jgi:hypothetical protein
METATQNTRDIQHGKRYTAVQDIELALRHHEGYSRAEDAGRHRKTQEKGDIKQSKLGHSRAQKHRTRQRPRFLI